MRRLPATMAKQLRYPAQLDHVSKSAAGTECNRAVELPKPASLEIFIAGAALFMLLAAQWMLSGAVAGTNYYGADGRMAVATILAALKLGGLFQINNINPIEGVGSQLLTMNAWANPAYWPFGLLAKETATDVSALVALGGFMIACYIMARCFDLPVVASAVAAQLCIALFAPALLILSARLTPPSPWRRGSPCSTCALPI